MRKVVATLLLGSLMVMGIACQPTTISTGSAAPETKQAPVLEVETETAVPQPATNIPTTKPAATETAVPEAVTSPTPTRNTEFSAEPLPTISMEEAPMPKPPSNAIELDPEKYPDSVNIAVADLAQQLAVDEASIEVVYVASVIWPDASLGCPQPDMAYRQVPKDGILIHLQADKKIYSYHGGGTREPFLCQSPDKGMKQNEGLQPAPGDMDT